METALCLMECGQPVYPLEIVRTMRDQRAMMIQTPVCTCRDFSIFFPRRTHPRLLQTFCFNLVFVCQSQYRFVCEAILKVYEEGLVKPLNTATYQLREKADDQKKDGEGEELTVTEDGEPVATDLLEGVEDEEDDDDEEVEVLDVGEVTEEEEEEEEDAEEPSIASETSANPEADPAANP